VFDFEDGKTVKYDFATKTAIGKMGKPVKNLCTQLRGLTVDQMCDMCVDKQYGKFLKFIESSCRADCKYISNIGTILKYVPSYAKFEQIFSAGIDNVSRDFIYSLSDVPRGLVKLCKEYDIQLSNGIFNSFIQNPNGWILAFNMDYTSLTKRDVKTVLTGNSYGIPIYNGKSYFTRLTNDYGYTAKNLMLYIDHLKTFEALDDVYMLIREIYDYASMMKKISDKFDRYPRHFLTTHAIASRNYNRLKSQFDELKFQSRINKSMEKTFGDYVFIYPDSTQDIKDESVSMNNCVSSYISRVIDGKCDIMFMRYKDSPDKSLVTIEVQNNKIVQALQKYNNPLTSEQQKTVDKWNKWWGNKVKESDELAVA
jgi:hypothetical protein